MPELPDVTVDVKHLERRLLGAALSTVRVLQPNLLRTVAPAPADVVGKRIVLVERPGKRIVLAFEGDLHFVLPLMIAGRLRWTPADALPAKTGKIGSATFAYSPGTLVLTEAGTRAGSSRWRPPRPSSGRRSRQRTTRSSAP